MALFNTVAVHITLTDSGGVERNVVLPNIKRPVEYKVLQDCLRKMGYPTECKFTSKTKFKLRVTDGQSSFDEAIGGTINLDHPLLVYYNDCYLPVAYPQDEAGSEQSSGADILSGQRIEIGSLATVGFQRTIRVPDNDKTHALPPDMGPFPVYNIADIVDHLPKEIAAKGGVCIPMYQREAMWISFKTNVPGCAVKVSVGGVNALTGVSQGVSVPGRQDYLALSKSRDGQLWLDGISTSPGVVRQFVAVPLGKGLTVEGQLTASEAQGGIQIDVFPQVPTTVSFYSTETLSHSDLYNKHKTPRQLGLSDGENLWMKNLRDPHINLSERDHPMFNPGITIGHLYLKTISYNIQIKSTPLYRSGVGKSYSGIILSGLAAGGRISQKINKDPLPPFSYDYKRGYRLHVTIINAAHFTTLTGLPTPSSPIKTSTYIEEFLPWYELYDEHIPTANNNSIPNPLSTVKPIGALLAQASSGTNHPSRDIATDCVYCEHEFAVMTLQPCGHDVCATVSRCPSCERVILGRDRFAAPMGTMESEHNMGGSLNEPIVKLRLNSGTLKVTSFKDPKHDISPLNGDGEDYVHSRT